MERREAVKATTDIDPNGDECTSWAGIFEIRLHRIFIETTRIVAFLPSRRPAMPGTVIVMATTTV